MLFSEWAVPSGTVGPSIRRPPGTPGLRCLLIPTAMVGSVRFPFPRAVPACQSPGMTDLDARKAVLRGKLKERRAAAAAANGAAVAALAAERFLAAVPLRAGQAVAGYWPMADELDPRPLLGMLRQRGMLQIGRAHV